MAAASGTLFGDFIELLVELGIADVILPFILIFTLVFAILEKTKIIGSGKKNFNIMVSLVIALLVVIPHIMGTYQGYDVVNAINAAVPKVTYWIVLFIMFLILIGVFGVRIKAGSLTGIIAILSFLIVVVIFASTAGWFNNIPFLAFLKYIDRRVIALIIIIAVFAGIIAYVSSDSSGGGGGGTGTRNSFSKFLSDLTESLEAK